MVASAWRSWGDSFAVLLGCQLPGALTRSPGIAGLFVQECLAFLACSFPQSSKGDFSMVKRGVQARVTLPSLETEAGQRSAECFHNQRLFKGHTAHNKLVEHKGWKGVGKEPSKSVQGQFKKWWCDVCTLPRSLLDLCEKYWDLITNDIPTHFIAVCTVRVRDDY